MIYQYSCQHCQAVFDVVKPARDFERAENCPGCNELAKRDFAPMNLHLVHTKVQEKEYNPGLGCITNSRQHRAEICKQKGLEEVGTEPVEKLHEHHEKVRHEKWERGWADADKGWVGSE